MKVLKKVLKFLRIIYFADSIQEAQEDYRAAVSKRRKEKIILVWEELSKKEIESAFGAKEIIKAFIHSPHESKARQTGLVRVLQEVSWQDLFELMSFSPSVHDLTNKEWIAIKSRFSAIYIDRFIKKVNSGEISTVAGINGFFQEDKKSYSSWLDKEHSEIITNRIHEFRKQETEKALNFNQKLSKMAEFKNTSEGEECITSIIPLIDNLNKAKAVLKILKAPGNPPWFIFGNLEVMHNQIYLKYLEFLEDKRLLVSLLKRTGDGSREEKIILNKLEVFLPITKQQ